MNALRHFLAHLRSPEGRQSRKIFRNFFIVLTVILAIHTTLFIAIMGREQMLLEDGLKVPYFCTNPTFLFPCGFLILSWIAREPF